MLNYGNLNDVEFEYLCQDIMSKILNVDLQRFGSGRDGGVDLTDNSSTYNIVVQAKHYVKTSVSGLLSRLRNEVAKIKKLSPNQYYVCCSKELTAENKSEIYNYFSDYMASPANIITLIEIDDFLAKPENKEILMKHFKLWLDSTNILSEIFTSNIFIDCEALLYNIEEEQKLFVKTSAFDEALRCLEKNNALIILGDPGVGKTTISKMLILHYSALGYRIRYTSDVTDLAELKKSLSERSVKEVILLDDCFGQAYFDMKSTQETELLALIRYIKTCKEKIILMNSRVTIYNDVSNRSTELISSFNSNQCKVYKLDLNHMPLLEKAKILYNHMYFNNVPYEYRAIIKSDRNYWKIIKHDNYNPRIIEYLCNPQLISRIPKEQYLSHIIETLNNPQKVWKNEYEQRLSKIDRILVTTLYSLSNNFARLDLVKNCFNHRIKSLPDIDTSINQFENSLNRLLDSFIKITDVYGIKMISTSNPSINDFLSNYLEQNTPEMEELIETCMSVQQMKRLLSDEEYKTKLSNLFNDKSILNFFFDDDEQKAAFITYYVASNQIKDLSFKPYISDYLYNLNQVKIFERERIYPINILKMLLQKDICMFYEVNKVIRDFEIFSHILSELDFEDMIQFINASAWIIDEEIKDKYVTIIKEELEAAMEMYLDNIDADDFAEEIDVDYIIDSNTNKSYYGDDYEENVDTFEVVSEVENKVEELALDEAYRLLNDIPTEYRPDDSKISNMCINVSGAEGVAESHMDYGDYEGHSFSSRGDWNPEIDYIFLRDE